MLRKWALSPIVIPRSVVVVVASLFVALGVDLALAGTPALTMQLRHNYLFPYGVAIAVTALLALVGCAMTKALVEMIGALLLFCLLSLYVIATALLAGQNLEHAALAIIVLIASLLEGWRGFDLLFAAIRKWIAPRV